MEMLKIGLLILEQIAFRNTYLNVKGANRCQISTLLKINACWAQILNQ